MPRAAYIFPGQGVQFVGMGQKLYRTSRRAKEVFDLVDASLSFPLSSVIFEGSDRELRRTVNSQPAIMAVSLAALEAVREFHQEVEIQPVAFAGHSLGEYTSLVASGVLGLVDGVRLVRERGRLMQEAADQQPGGMAVILGLDEITLDEVCQETGAEIANINTDDQIVISGERIALARAMDLASARGARKTLPLAVAGAFHSHLMSPAWEGLAQALSETIIWDPKVPIIANSTATQLTSAQEIKEELMNQLCSCVQWKRSIRCMIDMGVSTFIEFGPGKVLNGLVKRITRQARIINVGDLATARRLAEQSAAL